MTVELSTDVGGVDQTLVDHVTKHHAARLAPLAALDRVILGNWEGENFVIVSRVAEFVA